MIVATAKKVEAFAGRCLDALSERIFGDAARKCAAQLDAIENQMRERESRCGCRAKDASKAVGA